MTSIASSKNIDRATATTFLEPVSGASYSCNECVHRLGVAQVAEAVLREVESQARCRTHSALMELRINSVGYEWKKDNRQQVERQTKLQEIRRSVASWAHDHEICGKSVRRGERHGGR
jgi:hypothetical protein